MAGETIDEFKTFPIFTMRGKVLHIASHKAVGEVPAFEMTILDARSNNPVILVADMESDCYEECKEINADDMVRVSGRFFPRGTCRDHTNHIHLMVDRIRHDP